MSARDSEGHVWYQGITGARVCFRCQAKEQAAHPPSVPSPCTGENDRLIRRIAPGLLRPAPAGNG